MKVAIIGGGPRGLWAAEQLLELARQRSTDVDLHVYDDGRGVAYDVTQPKEWLVNVRSSIIRTQLGKFDDWLRARGVETEYPPRRMVGRSEEHTSELQSRFDLVCRLLLEKKK